jgi:hypothetical protein
MAHILGIDGRPLRDRQIEIREACGAGYCMMWVPGAEDAGIYATEADLASGRLTRDQMYDQLARECGYLGEPI